MAALAQVHAANDVAASSSTKDAIKPATVEPRTKIYGWIEAGVTCNPSSPDDKQNFGRLFDDRSNEFLLNQLSLTAERTLDPAAKGFDWGFKTQIMYGSDARFIHSTGILDHVSDSRFQPDLVEAYLNLHAPVLTEGGVDFKVGKFVTLEGAETIDPRTNVFYSHSYLFNFGVPLTHTGALATVHATKWLDLIGGITRGVNTSLDDNNDSASFHGGFLLNLLDGKLTALASTHIGPETPNNNSDFRYLSDLTITWKITDKFTSITDFNYIDDAAVKATGYGVAQYFTYQINEWLSAGLRAEVWHDNNGFYVMQFGNNTDPMHALRGDAGWVPDTRTVGGGNTTYGAVTLGANIKLPVSGIIEGLMLRPEVRFDGALNNGTRPFNDSKDTSMFTMGVDAIMKF